MPGRVPMTSLTGYVPEGTGEVLTALRSGPRAHRSTFVRPGGTVSYQSVPGYCATVASIVDSPCARRCCAAELHLRAN